MEAVFFGIISHLLRRLLPNYEKKVGLKGFGFQKKQAKKPLIFPDVSSGDMPFCLGSQCSDVIKLSLSVIMPLPNY